MSFKCTAAYLKFTCWVQVHAQVLGVLVIQPFSLLIHSKLFLLPSAMFPSAHPNISAGSRYSPALSWKLLYSEGNSVRLRKLLWWDWISSGHHQEHLENPPEPQQPIGLLQTAQVPLPGLCNTNLPVLGLQTSFPRIPTCSSLTSAVKSVSCGPNTSTKVTCSAG